MPLPPEVSSCLAEARGALDALEREAELALDEATTKGAELDEARQRASANSSQVTELEEELDKERGESRRLREQLQRREERIRRLEEARDALEDQLARAEGRPALCERRSVSRPRRDAGGDHSRDAGGRDGGRDGGGRRDGDRRSRQRSGASRSPRRQQQQQQPQQGGGPRSGSRRAGRGGGDPRGRPAGDRDKSIPREPVAQRAGARLQQVSGREGQKSTHRDERRRDERHRDERRGDHQRSPSGRGAWRSPTPAPGTVLAGQNGSKSPSRSTSVHLNIRMPHNKEYDGGLVEATVINRPSVNSGGEPVWQAQIEMALGSFGGRTRPVDIRGPPRRLQEDAERDAKQLTEASVQGPGQVRAIANALHRGGQASRSGHGE